MSSSEKIKDPYDTTYYWNRPARERARNLQQQKEQQFEMEKQKMKFYQIEMEKQMMKFYAKKEQESNDLKQIQMEKQKNLYAKKKATT